MSRRMYLPAPTVYEGPDQCPSCLGRCVTGEQYGMHTGSGTTIVADAFCPVCDGCGRDERHVSCTPMDHAAWRPGDCYGEGIDEDACPSCHGRRWNRSMLPCTCPGEHLTYHLRVPCDCATPLMVPLDEEEDEDAVDNAAADAALADPSPSIPAEKVWEQLDIEPEPSTQDGEG